MGLGYDSYEEALAARRKWERGSKPLKRTSGLSRGRGINPVNPERRKKRFERQYHSEARVTFVREMGCAVCGAKPADNAHVKTGGMGMKADYIWTAPLCRPHHVEYDLGKSAFEEEYDVDMEAVAKDVERRWLEHQGESDG